MQALAQPYRRRARLLAAIGVVLIASVALAQDGGFIVEAQPELGIAPVAAAPTAATSLDDPMLYVKVITDAVEHKAWGSLAAAVLVLLVALFRMFGKKLHDWLRDDHPLDKALAFLYDTKPGGWLLNSTFATAGGFGMTLLAGQPVTFELARAVVGVSFTAAGIWGLIKDVLEWWKNRKPPAAPAQAAGVEAAKNPGPTLNG